MKSKKYVTCLTIGGSDSGGGAGIQADLKTFSALGCFGASVITAITAQNTVEVRSIANVSTTMIQDQIEAVLDDISVDAIKIGMLHLPDVVKTVAEALKKYPHIPIILDPVMVAKSGNLLLEKAAVDSIRKYLFPLATLITPNLPEAETLTGVRINSKKDVENAALSILNRGCKSVLIKGGHQPGPTVSDYLLLNDERYQWFESTRINTNNTHGTGCTLSSAIAAYIAKGLNMLDSVEKGRAYLMHALTSGADYETGKGYGPVLHFWESWK